MSWEMHEAAKKIADGWYSELETTRKRNAVLERENAKLRKLARDFDKCLDTALWLASEAGYPVMPDQKLFDSLRPRMRELGVES